MDANVFTQKSLQAIQRAQSTAIEYGNAELTTLHLCYALTETDGLAARILQRVGIDASGLATALKEEIERLPRVSGAAGQPYGSAALNRLFIFFCVCLIISSGDWIAFLRGSAYKKRSF